MDQKNLLFNTSKLALRVWLEINLLVIPRDMKQRHSNRDMILPKVILFYPEKYLYSTFLSEKEGTMNVLKPD